LSDIRPTNITERRTRIDQAHVTEILQSCQVLLLLPLHAVGGEGTSVWTLQPATTKCQGPEGLVDVLKEFLGAREAKRDVRSVEIFHVMRAFQILGQR
jgi:hypothetical protein